MDPLEKMKALEKEYRQYLPKKSFAVIRVDGKGFSKYTKNLQKPFDGEFTEDMRATARYLCENIDGALLAYTQSDEISVIFSDLAGENTEWWFGGQVLKIASISAALATAKFNSNRLGSDLAVFDARVHRLDGLQDVEQYLDWRQSDAIKNSVSMLASHHFPHRQLEGKSTHERIRMLSLEKEVAWSALAPCFREGSLVNREVQDKKIVYMHNGRQNSVEVQRKKWVVSDAPRFSEVDVEGLIV